MTKIVINRKYGGFHLSALAVSRIAERKGRPCNFFRDEFNYGQRNYKLITLTQATELGISYLAFDVQKAKIDDSEFWLEHHLDYNYIDRSDPDLVAVIEELGERANTYVSKLKIVEIPDGIEWEIDDHDGVESVSEKHQTWV